MADKDMNSLQETLRNIVNARPVYNDLITKFSPLLEKQAALEELFRKTGPTPPVLDTYRLESGVPVMAEADCQEVEKALIIAAQSLIPVLPGIIPMDQAHSGGLLERGAEFWAKLAEARISGDSKYFEMLAEKGEMPPVNALVSITDSILAPVLASMVAKLDSSFSANHWTHGNCPFCGSLPSMAFLSARPKSSSEYLVGGGGKKHLHCSLCGHDWAFRRDTCPGCGNTDQDTKEIFFVDGVRHERIEVCHKCGTYCLCADFREMDSIPQLNALQIGLVHLDIIAQEKNLVPLTPTTWNDLGS